MFHSLLWVAALVSTGAQAAPGTNKGLEYVCERVFDTYATEDLLAAVDESVFPEGVCSGEIALSHGKCDAPSAALIGSHGAYVQWTPVDASELASDGPWPVFVLSVFDTAALDTARELSIKINGAQVALDWKMTPDVPFTVIGELEPVSGGWILHLTPPSGVDYKVAVSPTLVPAGSLAPTVTSRTIATDGTTTTTATVTVTAKTRPKGGSEVLLHELRGLALEVTLD